MKGEKILIVEDDKKTAELMKLYLVREGFRVITAHDGKTGLEKAHKENPDVILLDVMLPAVDGVTVCRKLRENSDVGIIMLTARTTEQDRLTGLNCGADDYVVKPFSPKEVTARVKAVLRRLPGSSVRKGPDSVVQGQLEVDFLHRTVKVAGAGVQLTPVEFRLLGLMIREPGRVFTREQLVNGVYGMDFEGYDRTIDVHVGNIRRKLALACKGSRAGMEDGKHPAGRNYIKTVFGVGYMFEAFSESADFSGPPTFSSRNEGPDGIGRPGGTGGSKPDGPGKTGGPDGTDKTDGKE